jgi:predicted O-methyltransferase YrrM
MTTTTHTPEVARLEAMVAGVPGWTPLDQLGALFALAFGSSVDGDIIEVGSWCGRSATALGLAAQATGGTTVHAVDLFPARSDWRRNEDGTYSLAVRVGAVEVHALEAQRVWAEPYLRDIEPVYRDSESVRDIFDRTIARNGLSGIVRAFQGTLDMFAAAIGPDLRCKLAFIDGEHSYPAVCRDLDVIERYLVPGAWVCFDDAHSGYEGVDRAVADRVLASGRYDRTVQITRKLFVARRAW